MTGDKRLSELYRIETQRLSQAQHALTGDYSHPVFGQGGVPAELMLLGEAPGADEARCGRPFVGKAGRQLVELLLGAGIEREKVFITKTVQYRPTHEKARTVSNRTPGKREIEDGLELLRQEVDIVAPRIIATLGNTPLFAVLRLAGIKEASVGQTHGRRMQLYIGERTYLLFALYHPASAIYNPKLLPLMREDILALGALWKEAGES